MLSMYLKSLSILSVLQKVRRIYLPVGSLKAIVEVPGPGVGQFRNSYLSLSFSLRYSYLAISNFKISCSFFLNFWISLQYYSCCISRSFRSCSIPRRLNLLISSSQMNESIALGGQQPPQFLDQESPSLKNILYSSKEQSPSCRRTTQRSPPDQLCDLRMALMGGQLLSSSLSLTQVYSAVLCSSPKAMKLRLIRVEMLGSLRVWYRPMDYSLLLHITRRRGRPSRFAFSMFWSW